jgi:galactose mutarotase-like enzyme
MTEMLKKVSPQNPKSFFIVNLHGARKTVTLNGTPILIETGRSDGKIASTHPCTPNFANKENAFGLPQHGPARDADWKLVTETDDSVTISYNIEGGTYPSGLKIVQTLRITHDNFELYTVHTYNGKVPAPLIYGEHLYWDAPQGIDGMQINNEALQSYKGFNTTFHTDGTVIPFDIKNSITIPGKPVVKLEQENMPVAVTWQGQNDTTYVCVEPVTMNPQKDEKGVPYFGSATSLMKPGETKTAYLSVSV